MNKPPFSTSMNALIHRWCQWCVDHQKMIPLQEWLGYTLPIEDIRLIQKVYEEKSCPQG